MYNLYVYRDVGQQIQTRQRTNTESGHLYPDIYMKICTIMQYLYTRALRFFAFVDICTLLQLLLHSRFKKIRRDMACFGQYMTV